MSGHIESPFSRYFLTILRNQADFVRKDSECGLDNLRRIAHLEVQLRHDAASETEHISILDMSTVGAQVDRDAAGARSFTGRRRCEYVRFAIRRIDHVGVASLPKSRDMIDVYSQFDH